MDIEEYLVQVIRKEKTGLIPGLILIVLTILAKIYRITVYIRRKSYDWGIKEGKSLDCTVISVGNITVGGTGKTPTVKKLALDLEAAGYNSVILSRGYKGDFDDEIGVVSDGNSITMSPDEAGDEPYLLARFLDSIPVIVGSKRQKTGKYAWARFKPDFIILDDGFQHWQVERDYDIVAIDAVHPFGEGELLPGGLLREPLSSLERADTVIITRADQVEEEKLAKIKAQIKEIKSKLKIISTKHQPTYLRNVTSNQCQAIDVQGSRVMAVSGIGNPRSFEMTLEELGANIVKKMRYQDHHSYNEDEINRLFTLATVHNVDKIITTEKDAVSMDNDLIELNNVDIDVQALGIELEILEGAETWDSVLDELEEASK
ncbi:tetraacyldisaccharide 4'-kinase [Halanaerobacter jeridensis]|uniref:Tetraacyldisaccharide 4'-kinase n=1 Tax=Halanaerobacter jeridensis TaxID=706427 RepID=A0A939BPF3_9FIRM|nr:tetraacyldisaccharide 4'-kinase [Halanaerobacter jeridensis]MBM7556972.1 tetraacyldisaccharide 4'-kinase [Halanaerobacter jeridensis]